jgi:hypothetical protein
LTTTERIALENAAVDAGASNVLFEGTPAHIHIGGIPLSAAAFDPQTVSMAAIAIMLGGLYWNSTR